MKRTTWQKQHKWMGILFSFFMLMFCLSGIVLNHRSSVSDIDVSRKWLPDRYRYTKWNGGLLRGTTPCKVGADSCVLIYGTSGIWKTDRTASRVSDLNKGLPGGSDLRQIKNMVQTPDSSLYAASIFGLYRYDGPDYGWRPVALPKDNDEMLTDMICRTDTLIVAGRSYLYISTPPYRSFKKLQLQQPNGYRNQVSLFRTIWLLHGGGLFGMPGRILMDIVAVILIVICITGLMYWLLPKYVRRRHRQGANTGAAVKITRKSFLWHERLGRSTIILTMFVAISGWCLRPPVLILLALAKVPAIPGTQLYSTNPWNDKLRMIRYDDGRGDWILSTSEGFYSLNTLDSTPVRINHAPPVSVMGLNVFRKDKSGNWLCGSFSGMFVWDRNKDMITDYFTGEPAPEKAGPPFGKRAVSGYSQDLAVTPFTVEHYDGTDALPQPAGLEELPMSLYGIALEVHNGRFYMGAPATYVFVFFSGILAGWILWSGWKLRIRSGRK